MMSRYSSVAPGAPTAACGIRVRTLPGLGRIPAKRATIGEQNGAPPRRCTRLPPCGAASRRVRKPSVTGVFRKPSPRRGLATSTRTGAAVVVAASANTYRESGRHFHPENVQVKRILGEGCYGQVFEGVLMDSGKEVGVVLKKVKPRVEGAQEMMEMEHMLNAHVTQAAKGACAEFMGYMNVTKENATRRVTQGLWLLWEFRGSRTMSFYMRHRNGIELMAEDLGVTLESAVPTAMKQVLGCLRDLHAARIVHRDVKPLNMIMDERERRFRLIDLGAAVDLASGMNYEPDVSILDEYYCGPELYVLPTDSVDLAEQAFPVAMVVSPMLWAKHQPDRFDIYSAGLVLMQLAIPQLRSPRGLVAFNDAIKKADYDLAAWRESCRHGYARSNAVLDAEDGAGWKLAAAMLRKRTLEGEVDLDGNVQQQTRGLPRPSAASCLNYVFIKQADRPAEEAAPAEAEAGAWSNAFGAWKKISNRLFSLEASIVSQTSMTSKQKGAVKKLKEEVASGASDAAKEALEAEQVKLEEMERQLKKDVGSFERLTVGASKWLSSFLESDSREPSSDEASKDEQQEPEEVVAETPAAPVSADLTETVEDVSKRTKGSGDIVDIGAAFGSLAARVAGDMASALKEDAEQRAARAAARAAKAAEEARLKEEKQRRDAEEAATVAAAKDPVVTPEVLHPEELSVEASAAAESNEGLAAAADEAGPLQQSQDWSKEERVLFAARLQRLQEKEERELRMQREVEFRQMLDELKDPAVTPKTPWPVVRRRVWSDYRFVAVEPDRRETVFAEYIEILDEYQQAMARDSSVDEPEPSDELAAQDGEGNNDGGAAGEHDLQSDISGQAKELDKLVTSAVEDLQSLQQSMHDEYSVLEEKLAEMEKSLLLKETQLKWVRTKHKDAQSSASVKAATEEKMPEFSPGFQGELMHRKQGTRRNSNPEGWLKRGAEPDSEDNPAAKGKAQTPH